MTRAYAHLTAVTSCLIPLAARDLPVLAQVVLWHVPSFEAFSEGVGSPGTSVRQPASRYPAVVTSQAYDEHDDSVYGAAWSAADPWVFASLSYDGNLVVNGVPNSTKYKILL